LILDNIPVGILFLDKKGEIIYRNRIATELPENDIAKIARGKETLYKIGKKYYKIRKTTVAEGHLITIEDVTEQVVAENALKESEERYRAICESTPMGIILMKHNEIIYVNKNFERMLGYHGKKIKENFFDLVHPEDQHKFDKLLKGETLQMKFFDSNGAVKWLEMGCGKITESEETHLINAIDITQRKEMEMNLIDAHEKMQKVLERERKFLEEVSHYFFNPLCIAKGYLDLSIPNADPQLRRKLEITKQAVSRVENVVKHIVTEGRIYE